MGIVWWIYGIGLQGDRPTWEPREIVFGDLSESESHVAQLGEDSISTIRASELVDLYCPGLVDATVAVQRQRYVDQNPNLVMDYDPPKPYCTESVAEKLAVDEQTMADNLREDNLQLASDAGDRGISDSRVLSDAELEEKIALKIDDQKRKLSQLTLSDLAAISGGIIEDARADGILDFNGWNLLSSSAAGEAIATADAFLVSNSATPFYLSLIHI